jgi:hypothetical protein
MSVSGAKPMRKKGVNQNNGQKGYRTIRLVEASGVNHHKLRNTHIHLLPIQ